MPAQIEFDRKDQTYIVREYLSGTGMQTLADEFGVSIPVIRTTAMNMTMNTTTATTMTMNTTKEIPMTMIMTTATTMAAT